LSYFSFETYAVLQNYQWKKKISLNQQLVQGMKEEQVSTAGLQKNRKKSPEQAMLWMQNAFPVALFCDSIS